MLKQLDRDYYDDDDGDLVVVGVYAAMEIHRTHCFGKTPDLYSYVETSVREDAWNKTEFKHAIDFS